MKKTTFWFALLAFAMYASSVNANDLPKTSFNMIALVVPASVATTQKGMPIPQTVVATSPAQPQYEYRQVQVCYGNFCRMEWRLTPVNPTPITQQQFQQNVICTTGR